MSVTVTQGGQKNSPPWRVRIRVFLAEEWTSRVGEEVGALKESKSGIEAGKEEERQIGQSKGRRAGGDREDSPLRPSVGADYAKAADLPGSAFLS